MDFLYPTDFFYLNHFIAKPMQVYEVNVTLVYPVRKKSSSET